MRTALALAVLMLITAPVPAALKEDPSTGRFGPVKVIKKKAWRSGNQSGFIVSYRIDGKTYKGGKVYCRAASHPMYLVENLDRGDGVKLGVVVGAEGGSGIAADLAPRYMDWAIDVWLQACR